MKVHLLVPAGFRTRPTGGNVYDRNLCDGLSARGWDVVVHELVPGEVPTCGGDPVLVDSLVASWAPEAFTGAVPLVHMVFGVPGERELLAEATAVITTSAHTRAQLVRAHLDPRRVHVAEPGVVRSLPNPGSAPGNRLLCVATVAPAKGQDVLLAALGWLTDLDWSLTLAGSVDADPAFVDELTKQAADAGITERVHVAGELSGPALQEAYRTSDLLVLPSRAETYGMVVTEALVHGLPVLATAVGGVPEALGTVAGDRPGMLVRPEDPDALARSLRRWLEDAPLRAWLRQRVALRRRTLPTWATTAAQVSQVLESLR